MKIEKLNENKIRITLNTKDLAEKNIDFHSFMSNSVESQNLFLEMLNEAEKRIGFITKDYKIRIEAFAMSAGDFIITITRFDKTISNPNKTLKLKRKNNDINPSDLIYKFDNFEDFCSFSNSISICNNIAKSIVLYFYKNTYYLCLKDLNLADKCNTLILLNEFATPVEKSEIYIKKLSEFGKIVIKNNAIKTCVKFFKCIHS